MKSQSLIYTWLLAGLCFATFSSENTVSRPKSSNVKNSITSDFNGTAIPSGTVLFTSVLKVQGVGNRKVTIRFTNQVINLNGTTISVPDATVVYNPSVTTATTTFQGNAWLTIVPVNGLAGNVFLSALAYQVPNGLPAGIKPVTWSGDFTTDTQGVTLQWQWAAAAYKCNFCNCQVMPKPVDDNKASAYQNSDHAGTPEGNGLKACLTGGARGGGGSNFTGSYSGTGAVTPTCTTTHVKTVPAAGTF